ncbi:MAG: phosphoglycolate phosphatase [Cryomorphaceae bacterium]|jgi:phosphoglycolate phosphatase
MKKHWIFDWSGTVVDDLGLVICATNHVLGLYGKPKMDRETFRREFCLPYEEFYKNHLPETNMEEVEAHFRHGFGISEVKVAVLPYAREFLDSLKADGCKLYVLSSMCEKAFGEQVVELGMDHYFEQTYAGVLDKREVIGGMMQTHGMVQEETVFVGDMTHDVDTAHHAGIMSVGVLTGYNHAPVLAASEPSIMVKDLSLLKNLLGSAKTSIDVVKIRGLELPTFIGVPDDERKDQQVLKVDVDMTPEVSFSSLNDEIQGGVDYYQVSLRLKETALEKPRKLIETLAEDLARVILDEFSVAKVRVEIEKYILPDADRVGVEIWR